MSRYPPSVGDSSAKAPVHILTRNAFRVAWLHYQNASVGPPRTGHRPPACKRPAPPGSPRHAPAPADCGVRGTSRDQWVPSQAAEGTGPIAGLVNIVMQRSIFTNLVLGFEKSPATTSPLGSISRRSQAGSPPDNPPTT